MRNATNKLLELIEEGVLTNDQVVMACVKFMSEDDVAEMCEANEFFEEAEEDEEDENNEDDIDEAQEWADYDPEC